MNGNYGLFEILVGTMLFVFATTLVIMINVMIIRWVFRIDIIVSLLEKIVKMKEIDDINLSAIRDYVRPECRCSLCQKPNERLTFINNKLLCKECINMIKNHQTPAVMKG